MSSSRQLEYRALNFMEACAAGRNAAEGDRHAASFRSWPGPPQVAARQLAAHANAARGRDVLWLIGLPSQGARARTGVDIKHLQTWLDGITPYFDGVAPRVTGFNVPAGGMTSGRAVRQVVALHIETTRAPFVVRRGNAAEVPWFDARDAAVRPAGRLELIKLLSPLEDLPRFEVLDAELTFYKNPHAGLTSKTAYRWTFDGSIYVMPQAEGRLVVPLHRCRGSVSNAQGGFRSEASDLSLTADKNSPAVRITESAALIEGLGRIFVYCCGSTAQECLPLQDALTVLFDLVPAGSDRAATVSAALRPEVTTENNQAGRWKL